METPTTFSIQDIARKQIETTKQVYLLSPQRMFSEYNGEKENVKNYNNRQLLEMLQNADDAASEAVGEKKVLIKLTENTLIIANTGYPFSEEGLISIFHSHLSPKEAKDNQIGKKGLGFRSILSWANKVTIKSHDLRVSFSQDYSKKVLDELLTNTNFQKDFHKLNKGHQIPISTLVCPDIESPNVIQFTDFETYDTIIQVDLFDKAKDQVVKQIQYDLDAEVLLFLNNLQKIDIDVNGSLLTYSKEILSPQSIKIVSNNNQSKVWNINSISGRFPDIDKPFHLSLAWQDNLKDCKDVVYAYFRTKVPINCKGIMHGSFELNADRNLIIDDGELGYNKKLVTLLPELIAQTAEKIAEKENVVVNYKPISFLHFDCKSLNHLINNSDLEDNLRSSIKTKKIFPTISNQYIHWDESQKPVYFEEEEFAKHLSPSKFPDLLLCCDEKEDEELINSLEPLIYRIESIIDEVVQKKDDITIEEYSKLIIAIYKYIDKDTDLNNRELFYDFANNSLNFNDPIFLPNTSSKYDLPKIFGVQIINTQLADELVKLTECENFSGLSSKLTNYKIKEYKFSELVEILIEHFSKPTTTEDIIELNKHLFNVYSSEENPGVKWLGKQVSLIDMKGFIRPANDLYFGKEYGNPLTEEIYSYNKGKILASKKKLNIDGVYENDWKKYLEWLGVEYYPRRLIKNGEHDYAEYVMRHYDYKHRIEDLYFKGGYKEFKRELTGGYETINVTSIDDIDNILLNNSSENIIQFLIQDEDLFKNVERDTETELSKISFWFYNLRNTRHIGGNKMKSYIKWKIGNSPWLNTDSNAKYQPALCSTATYINEDFSGLVERPKLEYEVLNNHGVNRDKVDYLLNIIGVHKSINTFSTSMLYSILLKLEDIDVDGKKAKTIYNQLAANYDDKLLDILDKTDSNYTDFHSSGRVFCKKGVYVPIQEVYYVNDKRYGETIIKQFNVIEIERRRGKEKIQKLFGVMPLDKIELNLDGTPNYHNLNTFFVAELESFKPYVYVLRKEVDGGSEKNIIKDTKFELVTQLKLNLIKDGIPQSIVLNDYEYYYLKKRNSVFIKCPEYLTSIQDLKEDIHICSAIAEAFSAILDVDAQRQQIRELFSKTGIARDELLRTELDDNNLQKLNEARRILGITNNPKLEFWKSFSKCLIGKKIVLKNESDTELLEKLKENLPQYIEVIDLVFNEINYQEINEEISSEWIVKLFKETGVKISLFNQFHYPSFDIKELYEINFKRTIDLYKIAFKSSYYEKCIASNDLKVDFTGVLYAYNAIQPKVRNEVDFDPKQDLFEQLKTTYGIEMTIEVQDRNIDDLYKKNLELLWKATEQKLGERNLFEQFIYEDTQCQSLLYFDDQISIIEERLRTWLGRTHEDENKGNATTKSKRLSFGNQTILYDNFSDLRNQVDSILDIEGLKNVSSNTIRTVKTEIGKHDSKNSSSPSIPSQKPKVPKEEVGFLGEYLTYRFLLETINDKNSVKWVSKYAKECGINLDGKDGLGYDIEYIPNGAKYPRYVEVKVVGWEDAFHISSNEVKYGEKYKLNYEIFLIRNLETPTQAKIERIQGLFDYKGKSFTNNDLFSVINDNYIIKFKKVE